MLNARGNTVSNVIQPPNYQGDNLPSTEKAKRIIRDNKSATAAKSTCAKPPMIPRPRGRASRDYNVYDEMQVKDRIEFDKGMYNNIIVSPFNKFSSKLCSLPIAEHSSTWR